MTGRTTRTLRASAGDLGLRAVDRVYANMRIDDEWSVREDRGFTWWGAWVGERVWADEAVDTDGLTLWQVRARTPALRDQPDEPETYLLVDAFNDFAGMSGYVYDPDDGTISARCGVFLYADVAPWLERFLGLAVALQPSIAWQQVPALADGRPLDDAPHPEAGPRRDPDDMLNLAGRPAPGSSPFTPAVLHLAFVALEADGIAVSWDPSGRLVTTLVPLTADEPALWGIGSADHPVLGPGAIVRLCLPHRSGPVRAAWVANTLNAAEAADWHGESRPHALGTWGTEDGFVIHTLFCPAALFGEPDRDGALIALRNFLAWGATRAAFAGERLPWLLTAARSRFPDDEPSVDDGPPDDGATADEGTPRPEATDEAGESFDPENWGVRIHMAGERPERDEDAGVPVPPDPFDLLRQGRQADAVAAVDAHIASARGNLRRMHQFRSDVLIDLERWEEALAETDSALALDPVGDELVGILGTRGWVLSQLGRPADGLAEADRALAIGTADVEIATRVHVNRGFALSLLGDQDAAFAEYRTAIRLSPIDPLAHYNLACQHSLRHRLHESIDSLRTCLAIDPSYRLMARHDGDFASLRGDVTFGPRFRELVGADD